MLHWAFRHIVWFTIRCTVTLACLYTLQHVMESEGYRVESHSLLMVAVIFVIGVRMWAPSIKNKEENKETTWSQ